MQKDIKKEYISQAGVMGRAWEAVILLLGRAKMRLEESLNSEEGQS